MMPIKTHGAKEHLFFYKIWEFQSSKAARSADRDISHLRDELNEGCYYFSRGVVDNKIVIAFMGCTFIPKKTIAKMEQRTGRSGGKELPDGDEVRKVCVAMLNDKMTNFMRETPAHVVKEWHGEH